jgi:phosphohistidine phosphatase
VYIVRHAEAVEASDTLRDEWRYLTEKGRSVAETMGAAIAGAGPKPRLTITSPLTRAVQTAELLAENACRRNVVIASELLLPGGDIPAVIAYLKGCRAKRVMLVGHEPQLGLLATTLLRREEKTISLQKGACVALKFSPGKDKPANFLWYLAPGAQPVTSLKKACTRKNP